MGLSKNAHEREIEHLQANHVTEFLLDVDASFRFVGRQLSDQCLMASIYPVL
ncbi:hypothetical protein [Pseudomonas helleri]|uniref:hypothetical protein n=1 Tax=Pseudomonas helleri TaxID=1608996 RepID=UPI0030DC555B